MIIFNTAALAAGLYGIVYFLIFGSIFGMNQHVFLLSLILGDVTLRWLLILISDGFGGHVFRWLPKLIKGANRPAEGLPVFFLKRLFIPGMGGTLFFLPVWVCAALMLYWKSTEPTL